MKKTNSFKNIFDKSISQVGVIARKIEEVFSSNAGVGTSIGVGVAAALGVSAGVIPSIPELKDTTMGIIAYVSSFALPVVTGVAAVKIADVARAIGDACNVPAARVQSGFASEDRQPSNATVVNNGTASYKGGALKF
jgi:hypothetical protein